MALTFNPYPLEPWLQAQQNRQRPDLNQTVVQPLMQGLQMWQQSKEAQRQEALKQQMFELEKQKMAQDQQRWQTEQFGFDPSQYGMGMTPASPTQGLGTMFTQPQNGYAGPSDAPTMNTQPSGMGSHVSNFLYQKSTGQLRNRLKPNYLAMQQTQQPEIDYRDPSTWANRNDISIPQKTMLSGLFGKIKDAETQSDYQKLKETLDLQIKQAQLDAFKTKMDQGDIKQQKEQSKLASTLDLYEAAKKGLMEGLEGATTGPVLGRIPAFSAQSQVAEGGVAAMAPVLKQLFRVAGEGVFTDRDQALLLAMIPTRAVRPEARQVMMDNIDNIVKAKLGMSVKQAGQPEADVRPKTIIQNGYIYTLNEATGEYE